MKKAVILKAPGTNNEHESSYALELAGASAEIVHINELLAGSKRLDDYAMMVIPGGFSYGDDLGAGRIFALFLEHRMRRETLDFIGSGRPVLGICNGFQVLLKAGMLLPHGDERNVTLTRNAGGEFICRWVKLKVNRDLFWFAGLDEEIELPIAHAEGRFMSCGGAASALVEEGRVALTYCDNPNGSELDIAGIISGEGNVLGLMPHPDRFFSPLQYPAPGRGAVIPWGKVIFENMVRNA